MVIINNDQYFGSSSDKVLTRSSKQYRKVHAVVIEAGGHDDKLSSSADLGPLEAGLLVSFKPQGPQ